MKKHILCIGDSNTHGYCADANDCADGGIRFDETQRWTCLLQQLLGDDFLVIEEGLSGRTTVFADPLHENMDAYSCIYALLKSHEPIDLLIIMLGTNDAKDRFNVTANEIAIGMERLIAKAIATDCWKNQTNVLLVAPSPILKGINNTEYVYTMGAKCAEKSKKLAEQYKMLAEKLNIYFLDAADCQVNTIDFTHLTAKGHKKLADKIFKIVPSILK